jgi:hypothetical protein
MQPLPKEFSWPDTRPKYGGSITQATSFGKTVISAKTNIGRAWLVVSDCPADKSGTIFHGGTALRQAGHWQEKMV